MKGQPGYILATTLAFMAMLMLMGAYLANKSLVFGAYTKTMIAREKARQLAYGGIQLAMSQLAGEVTQPTPKATAGTEKEQAAQKDKDKQQEPPLSDGKQLLKQLLPIFGKPQTFALKQSIEGITGAIIITIGSEDGKINLNAAYDFDKHKFVGEGSAQGDMKKTMQEIFMLIKERMNVDLFPELEKYLKERKYPLNDVSELLTIKGFATFANASEPLTLNNLFTVSSLRGGLEPWLLSDGILAIAGAKRLTEKSADDLLKNYKDRADWKTEWAKIFKPLYGIDYAALPKGVAALLNAAFDPRTFNIISVGMAGDASIRLLAIVERARAADGTIKMMIRKMTIV